MLTLFAGIDSTGWSWDQKLVAGCVMFIIFCFATGGWKSVFGDKPQSKK